MEQTREGRRDGSRGKVGAARERSEREGAQMD